MPNLIKKFEKFNENNQSPKFDPKNWGAISKYGRYENHPLIGKKVSALYEGDPYAYRDGIITHIDIMGKNDKGYWGQLYIDRLDGTCFFTDSDEYLKFVVAVNGDFRDCRVVNGKLIVTGHDGTESVRVYEPEVSTPLPKASYGGGWTEKVNPFIGKKIGEVYNGANDSNNDSYQDRESVIGSIHYLDKTPYGYCGQIYFSMKNRGQDVLWEGPCMFSDNDKEIKILAYVPGDFRGCWIEDGLFFVEGHDDLEMYDILTGEQVYFDCALRTGKN